MSYNRKQYDAARDFVTEGDNNVVNSYDKLRVQCYDLYENYYLNSSYQLKIILRGEDQSPMLMPTGKKLVESVNRFLGINIDYLVEGEGDVGTNDNIDTWFKNFYKREAFKTKFESGKRWGLVRGDSVWYVYADETKPAGDRISIVEVDPRQVFEIEDINCCLAGYHVVDTVRDWREEENKNKFISRRRTFRKQVDDDGYVIKGSVVTTELTFWEIGKWDDRCEDNELEPVTEGAELHGAHDPIELSPTDGAPITALPLYIWNNAAMQNTSWGTSQLAGLETLLYALNQSLTDEDATIVFQGLGMYVTTAAPPINPQTGELDNWNIGPMQIIEIGQDQKFDRVSGITDISPFQDHMTFIDEKGLSESSGIPEVAIGRVDVATAESGISLQLQLMPLLAQNGEKELAMINLIDQMYHDIVTMWLPAFEWETFPDFGAIQECSVVVIFDDPMPVDRSSVVEEVVLLEEANLILTSMAVKKLRSLGWQYPVVDLDGNPVDDDGIVQMLLDQATAAATAANTGLLGPGTPGDLTAYDATGQSGQIASSVAATPVKQTVSLNGGKSS